MDSGRHYETRLKYAQKTEVVKTAVKQAPILNQNSMMLAEKNKRIKQSQDFSQSANAPLRNDKPIAHVSPVKQHGQKRIQQQNVPRQS